MNRECEHFDECAGGIDASDKCKGCNSNIVNVELCNLEINKLITLLNVEADSVNRYTRYFAPEAHQKYTEFIIDIRNKLEEQMDYVNS
jgi:hypothetical protein